MENPTRRRVLAAGLTGTALGLLGGRVASASPDTTEPTDDSSTPPTTADAAGDDDHAAAEAPDRRADIVLLNFAEIVELAARDLYQASIDAGAKDDLITLLLANHRGYADVIRGILGTRFARRPQRRAVRRASRPASRSPTRQALAAGRLRPRVDARRHPHRPARPARGHDGARTIASILIVEARQAAVLADVAGNGGDFDALFDDSATALTLPSGG